MIFEYLPSMILLTDVTFVGLLITYFLKLELFIEARIAAGALIGIVSLGCLMLIISSFLGLNLLGLVLFLVGFNLIGALLLKDNLTKIGNDLEDLRNRFRGFSWKLYFLFVGLFILIFGYLATQLMTFNDGRYFVQPVHAYGDISLHLGIISSFAFGNNFPIENPIFAGTKISYPFLVDFITAIFVNPLSLRLDQAVSLVGIMLMLILIILLSYFSYRITRSRMSACLVLVLFFFNGGLGFLYFLNDLQNSNSNFFQFIQILPRDYTALKDLGFFWINVILSMLLPQRSFLLGLPVAILILLIFWELSEQFNARKLLFGILLVSFLPIIHTYSLIAISPFLCWLTILILLKNKERIIPLWIFGLIGIAIVFTLSKIFLQQSDNPLAFIRPQFGWMAGKQNIISFYLYNFGLNLIVIPLAVLFGIKKNLKIAYFAVIGQLWFILPGLYIFQPWDYDNTKLFVYWYLSSIIVIAFFFSKLLLTRKIIYILFVFIIIYVLIFSGFLDITRLMFSYNTRYEIYSQQAIKLAEFVKNNTKPDSVFLSIDRFDNPVVSLAGRKVLVGYHAWLWTYGLNYSQRDEDLRLMLAGRSKKNLFDKYNISYVILFKDEQTDYQINRDYFKQNFNLIYSKDGYEIFAI